MEDQMTRGNKIALGFFVASIPAFAIAVLADSGRTAALGLGVICLVLAIANFKRARGAGNAPPAAEQAGSGGPAEPQAVGRRRAL